MLSPLSNLTYRHLFLAQVLSLQRWEPRTQLSLEAGDRWRKCTRIRTSPKYDGSVWSMVRESYAAYPRG
jgi:hypothetical protein